MPTPMSPGAEVPSVDPFAGPPPASRAGDGQLVVPGRRHAWTYAVSPEDLACCRGEILPVLRRATHQPGTNGNGRILGRGEGARTGLISRGYTEVPHGMEVVAFGQARVGYMVPHDTPIPGEGGKTVRSYTDCWCRPVRLGRLMQYEYDEEGRLDFRRRCLEFVAPGGLSPIQIKLATEPLIRSCRNMADRDDSKGTRFLIERLAHLPYEHAPPDLQALMREHDLAPAPSEPDPTPTPKGRRTKT